MYENDVIRKKTLFFYVYTNKWNSIIKKTIEHSPIEVQHLMIQQLEQV